VGGWGHKQEHPSPRPATLPPPAVPSRRGAADVRGGDSWFGPRATGAAPQARSPHQGKPMAVPAELGDPRAALSRAKACSPGRQELGSPSHPGTRSPRLFLGWASPHPGPVRGLGAGADNGGEMPRRNGLPRPRMADADDGKDGGTVATRQGAGGATAATTGAEGGGRGAGTSCDVSLRPAHSAPRGKGVPVRATKWFSGVRRNSSL